jgi:F-type H+-transporting ATPase subunit alpha
MELFKQPQYSPYPTEEQVVSIWLGTTGQLDSVDVGDVGRFEREFLDYLRRSSSVLKSIAETNKFTDDTAATLQTEVDQFKQEFTAGDGGGLQVGSEESAPSEDEDIEQERIVRQKR